MRTRTLVALGALVALVVAACGGGSSPSPSAGPTPIASLGSTDGQSISVLAWPGYVEDGSTDPAVDWVSDFEKESGCEVSYQIFGTSDEAYSLFTTNPEQFDVISASGDASLRLVRGGYVQPVNVELVPNYADIFEALKNKPYNTVDGVHYGIPHGRGSNLLMSRTDKVSPAPDSWSIMFDPASMYAGKVSIYDAPIYIADAAVYLMATNPDLKITNPYALDEKQFTAAVDLLKGQKPLVGQYWTDYLKQMDAFRAGDVEVGTTWQIITNLLQGEDPAVPVEVVKPKEGATGWSDTWMVNSKSKNVDCAYAFINHLVSPETNAAIAEWFGEAPGNSKSCALTADPNHCEIFHADDEAFWEDVWYWQTPEVACVDGRTDVECKGFDDWINAWTEIKG
jgi:putative spermidine/putrescine transport system substrate-binding protein